MEKPLNRTGPGAARKSIQDDPPIDVDLTVEKDPSGKHTVTFELRWRRPCSAPRKTTRVVLCVDTSGSMSKDMRMDRVKDALRSVVRSLTPQIELSLVTFSTDAIVQIKGVSSENPELVHEFNDIVNRLTPSGDTDIATALMRAVRSLAEDDEQADENIILLLTDGQANTGITGADAIANSFKKECADGCVSARVVALGIGHSFDPELIAKLADQTGGSSRGLRSTGEIPDAIARIFSSIHGGGAVEVRISAVPLLGGCEFRDMASAPPASCQGGWDGGAGGTPSAAGPAPKDREGRKPLVVRVGNILLPQDARDVFLEFDTGPAQAPSLTAGRTRPLFAWEVRYRVPGFTPHDDSKECCTRRVTYMETAQFALVATAEEGGRGRERRAAIIRYEDDRDGAGGSEEDGRREDAAGDDPSLDAGWHPRMVALPGDIVKPRASVTRAPIHLHPRGALATVTPIDSAPSSYADRCLSPGTSVGEDTRSVEAIEVERWFRQHVGPIIPQVRGRVYYEVGMKSMEEALKMLENIARSRGCDEEPSIANLIARLSNWITTEKQLPWSRKKATSPAQHRGTTT